MNVVLIILSSNPKVCQIIDILVADIPEFYGLILSRDWSEKLHGYFATDWSYLWLPYNRKPIQIHINREKHMTYSMTDLDEENELVVFTNNILGNYSLESFFDSFPTLNSPFPIYSVLSQIDSLRWINIVDNIVNMCDELF